MYYLVSSSDCTGADRSTSYYVVVCTSVLVSFSDFVARAGVRVARVRTGFGNEAKASYMMQSRADDVRNLLIDHLEEFHLLSTQQWGFTHGKSTTGA